MTMPSPNPSGGPRASRTVKLVLMGVAGAALLYSCAPGVGAGLGALPYLFWFLPNPFFRGPAISSGPTPGQTTTATPTPSKTAPAPTQSQRGGFGSTGGSSGSGGSS
jgi:uncharacterized membrane protein YgcG